MRLSPLMMLALGCSSSEPVQSVVDAAPPLADATRPDTSMALLPTTLASDLAEPRGIALIGDTLYVAEHFAGRIVAIPRAGGVARKVVDGRKGPWRIATDGQVLVVTEREAGDVVRVTTDGAVSVLASGLGAPTDVRIRDGTAYVVATGTDGGADSLWSMDLGGVSSAKIVDGIVRAASLSVGASVVYFSADQVQATSGNVFATPRAGDGGVTVVASTPNVAYGLFADEASGLVYWGVLKGQNPSAGHGWINRASLDGGMPEMIAIAPGGCVDHLQLSSSALYYTSCSTLMRVTSGGAHDDLAVNTYAGDFVVAGGAIYWTDVAAGRVYALPTP